MTAIRRVSGNSSRRPDVLGVHSLDHVHLAVPDLTEAGRFYGAFGLDLRTTAGGIELLTADSPHVWVRLTQGEKKALKHISFGAFKDDIPRFRERLVRLGIERRSAPGGFESDGLWFCDPDGTAIEIRAAEKTSPDAKPNAQDGPGLSGVANAPSRSCAPRVRPGRMAHILVFSRDVSRSVQFYADVLGLRLSDTSGEALAFLHAVHGSDHHVLALLKSGARGLHHLSWDVGSVHAIGLGAMQMARAGYERGWGLGRHVLGSNYFHYIRDPWGAYSEYACDIDYIPSDAEWQCRDHPAEDSFYVWGPQPPVDFAVNYEA